MKMKYDRLVGLFVLILLLFPAISNAANSENYKIERLTFSGGGQDTESSNYNLNFLTGTIAGITESVSYKLQLGFWYSTISEILIDNFWFLSILLSFVSVVFILLISLKNTPLGSKMLVIPAIFGALLLILIEINFLLKGLDVFSSDVNMTGVSSVVEGAYTTFLPLLPFIFILWGITIIVISIRSLNKF